MLRSSWKASILGIAAVGCAATTPGAQPHDMSVAGHEQEALAHSAMADKHAEQYDPDATTKTERCRPRSSSAAQAAIDLSDVCWTSVTNPTEQHQRQAQEHRRHAEDHRAGSAALREAEQSACVGIAPDDRDISPFHHVEDIASVEPLTNRAGIYSNTNVNLPTIGAVVTFRAVPGMTAEWLQRVVNCHLARNASLGHVVPGMPNCPLVPRGVQAQVQSVGNGFAVEIRSNDRATAQEILSRAQRLRGEPVK